MNDEVVSKLKFKCVRCGDCCKWHGYVKVSESEAEAIAQFIGMDTADFYENMLMPGDEGESVSLTENDDGSCPFYSDSPQGCRIYEVRPSQCMSYPLEWRNPDKRCPGLENVNEPGQTNG